jgi:hypothetical protein
MASPRPDRSGKFKDITNHRAEMIEQIDDFGVMRSDHNNRFVVPYRLHLKDDVGIGPCAELAEHGHGLAGAGLYEHDDDSCRGLF